MHNSNNPSDIRSYSFINRGGVAFDVVPASKNDIHSAEIIAV